LASSGEFIHHGGVMRFLRASTLSIALALATSIGGASVAFADPADEADRPPGDPAMVLKAKGDADMDRTEYQDALDAYVKAYALWKNPALLYNQGRALQALHRMPEALDKLMQFRKLASPALRAKVPKLDELIDEVSDRVSTLVLTVDQPGATVKLGNVVIGLTPLEETEVNAGKTMLEVSEEGFATVTREVTLPGRGRLELSIELVPKDRTGTLVVHSPVAGATVAVDGNVVGQVPSEIKVPAGPHTVKLTAPSHDAQSVNVIVVAGQSKTIDVALAGVPVAKQAWFWLTLVGSAAAVGGIAGGVYAGVTEGPPDRGTIGTGVVSVQIVMPPVHF
jgi:hypothetical protein